MSSNSPKFSDKKQAQRYLLGLRRGKAAERRRMRAERDEREAEEERDDAADLEEQD